MAKNFNAFFISNNQSDSSKTSSILFIHFFMIQKLEFFSVFNSSLSPLSEYRLYDYVVDLFKLKIRIDRKAELLNEYLLEGRNIVLFIKKQHSLFVVDAIYSSE